jgi:hypothetical protein
MPCRSWYPLACFLTPAQKSAQPDGGDAGDDNADTSSNQLDGDRNQGGRWTVRLEHSIQREYAPTKPLEEVTVRGQKPLSAYRRGVEAAEVEVWETYNGVNSDDADSGDAGQRFRLKPATIPEDAGPV